MKNTITEIKNTLERSNRLYKAEDPLSNFEEKVPKNTQSEQQNGGKSPQRRSV